MKSSKLTGLAPGSGSRVKTTVVPKGTIPNDIRPADKFVKTPPKDWGKRTK